LHLSNSVFTFCDNNLYLVTYTDLSDAMEKICNSTIITTLQLNLLNNLGFSQHLKLIVTDRKNIDWEDIQKRSEKIFPNYTVHVTWKKKRSEVKSIAKGIMG